MTTPCALTPTTLDLATQMRDAVVPLQEMADHPDLGDQARRYAVALVAMAQAMDRATGTSLVRRQALRQLFNTMLDTLDGSHTLTLAADIWADTGPVVTEVVRQAVLAREARLDGGERSRTEAALAAFCWTEEPA